MVSVQDYLRQQAQQARISGTQVRERVQRAFDNRNIVSQQQYQQRVEQNKQNFANQIAQIQRDNPSLIIIPDYNTFTIKSISERAPITTQPQERKDFGGQAIYAVEKPKTFVDKVNAYLSKLRRQGKTNQFLGLAAGAGASVISSGQALGNLFFHPVKTVTNIPLGLKSVYERAQSGEYARILREEPGYAIGYIGSEVLQGYGTGKAISGGVKLYQKQFPAKYSTTFLSQQAGTSGENLFFKTASTTTRKTPLSSRTFISGSQTQITPLLINEDKMLLKSGTQTATREIMRSFPTGKFIYKKPIASVSLDIAKVIPREVSIPLTRFVSKRLEEGFELQSVGKTRLLKAPKTTYYKSLSYGGNIEENLLGIYGRYIEISKKNGLPLKYKNFNEFLGRIKTMPEGIETVRILKSSKLLSKTKQINAQKIALTLQTQVAERIIDNTIRNEIAKKVSKIQKVTQTTLPISQLMYTPSQSIYAGTGLYERTEEVAALMPMTNIRSNELNRLLLPTASSLSQPSAIKFSQFLINPSTTAQKPREVSAQLSAQSSSQAQKQRQITKQNLIQRTNLRIITPFGFRPIIPFLVPDNRNKKYLRLSRLSKQQRKKRGYRRKPTTSQLLFKGLPVSKRQTQFLTGWELAR